MEMLPIKLSGAFAVEIVAHSVWIALGEALEIAHWEGSVKASSIVLDEVILKKA